MLKEFYQKEIIPKLKERLNISNVWAVPRVEKIVINVGVGKYTKDSNYIDEVERSLTVITGQKPIRTKSRISISNFKLREGQVVGLKVTMRGKRMYDFLEKLLRVTFPRMRDFRGISKKGFDRQGNFTVGFKEQIAFPEISGEDANRMHGLEITVVTTAKNQEQAKALLEELGFPFKKDKKDNK